LATNEIEKEKFQLPRSRKVVHKEEK